MASTTKCQFKLDKKLFWTAQSLRVKNVHNFQTREGGGQGILCIIEVYFPQNGVQLYYKCNTCHSDYHSLYLYRILCTHESAICSTRPPKTKDYSGNRKTSLPPPDPSPALLERNNYIRTYVRVILRSWENTAARLFPTNELLLREVYWPPVLPEKYIIS